MFFISKAQYRQLVKNTNEDGKYTHHDKWVTPLDLHPGHRDLVYLETGCTNFAHYGSSNLESYDDEHDFETYIVHDRVVSFTVIRFKFLWDLKRTYIHWKNCRNSRFDF